MDDKQSQKLKEILKSEFLPLFVGLRSELKALNDGVEKLYLKEVPEVSKTEIVNHQEPIKEVGISNLPEVQRVEVINQAEAVKEVAVTNLEPMLGSFKTNAIASILGLSETIKTAINGLKTSILKVQVENQKDFPSDIKVNNLSDIVIPKVEMPSSFKINNSLPSDAIPVILTDRDRKNFYNAFQQMYVGNDVNMDRVIKAIEAVTVDIGEINVDLDDVEALITATNVLLTSTNSLLTTISTIDFATETTLNQLLTDFNAEDFATETTLNTLLTDFNAEDFATETTLNQLLTDFNAEDFATETTLLLLEGKDFATETTLALLEAKDFATETTLLLLEGKDFATETTLALLEAKDFATETTLVDVKTAVESIDTDFDVALSTRLSELDFDTRVGEVQFTPTDYTILWRLKEIYDALQSGITIGQNAWQAGVHDGFGFIAGTNNINIAGNNEVDFMLIRNPVASGRILRIYKANFGTEAGVNSPSTWRMYRDPTVTTNGTVITPRNLRKSGGASVASSFSIPTISARGTFLGSDTFTAVGIDNVQDLGQIIEEGESFLITFDPSVSNNIHTALIYWVEELP